MPPTIVAPPISSVVAVGMSVALDCIVDGAPTPNITWFKDTRHLFGTRHVTVTSKSVYVGVANMSDSGVYMCVAENIAGRIAYQASITVVTALPSLSGMCALSLNNLFNVTAFSKWPTGG